MPATEVAKQLARITNWIDSNDETRPILKSLNAPATDTQIATVERKLGVKFPEQLRELYRVLNGQDARAVKLEGSEMD